jgi:hypothetical protein
MKNTQSFKLMSIPENYKDYQLDKEIEGSKELILKNMKNST